MLLHGWRISQKENNQTIKHPSVTRKHAVGKKIKSEEQKNKTKEEDGMMWATGNEDNPVETMTTTPTYSYIISTVLKP